MKRKIFKTGILYYLVGKLIKVLTETKGSNHGGRCLIERIPNNYGEYYLKHCSSSRIKKDQSNFVYQHQPIYEAVTCEMARKLGLETANFYILLNLDKKLLFISEGGQKVDIKPFQPYYFASEILVRSCNEDLKKAEKIIEEEKFYLDLLSISDIIGKKHNYIYDSFSDQVIYLDLGCNFVDANDNHISLKTHHKPPLNKKERKKALNKFEKYEIITKRGNGHSLGLIEFLESPKDMSILTMNPKENIRLNDLISQSEVNEITERLIVSLYYRNQLKRNRECPYLKKIK